MNSCRDSSEYELQFIVVMSNIVYMVAIEKYLLQIIIKITPIIKQIYPNNMHNIDNSVTLMLSILPH